MRDTIIGTGGRVGPSAYERFLRGERLTVAHKSGGLGDEVFALSGMGFLFAVMTWATAVTLDTHWALTLLCVAVWAAITYITLMVAGPVLSYAIARWRGEAPFEADAEGIRGAAVPVRGGRLRWADIRAVETVSHEGAGFGHSICLAVDPARLGGLRHRLSHLALGRQRFRHEVTLLTDGLDVRDYELGLLIEAGLQLYGAPEWRDTLEAAPAERTRKAASQDERVAALLRGETAVFPPRRWQLALQLVLLPLLAGLTLAIIGLPFLWLHIADSGDALWAVFAILLVLAIAVGPVLCYAVGSQVRITVQQLRGAPALAIGPDGIRLLDESGKALAVPWRDCTDAYVYNQYRGGVHVLLGVRAGSPVDPRRERSGLIGWIQALLSRLQHGRLAVPWGGTSMSPLQLSELLNAGIAHYNRSATTDRGAILPT